MKTTLTQNLTVICLPGQVTPMPTRTPPSQRRGSSVGKLRASGSSDSKWMASPIANVAQDGVPVVQDLNHSSRWPLASTAPVSVPVENGPPITLPITQPDEPQLLFRIAGMITAEDPSPKQRTAHSSLAVRLGSRRPLVGPGSTARSINHARLQGLPGLSRPQVEGVHHHHRWADELRAQSRRRRSGARIGGGRSSCTVQTRGARPSPTPLRSRQTTGPKSALSSSVKKVTASIGGERRSGQTPRSRFKSCRTTSPGGVAAGTSTACTTTSTN